MTLQSHYWSVGIFLRVGRGVTIPTRGTEYRMKHEELNSKTNICISLRMTFFFSLVEHPLKLIYKNVIGCSSPLHNIMQYTQ